MADGLAGGRAGGRLLLASVSGLNASPISNFFMGLEHVLAFGLCAPNSRWLFRAGLVFGLITSRPV